MHVRALEHAACGVQCTHLHDIQRLQTAYYVVVSVDRFERMLLSCLPFLCFPVNVMRRLFVSLAASFFSPDCCEKVRLLNLS